MILLVYREAIRLFVKKSWNTKEKKRYIQHHIVESYRDRKTGKNKHRYLLNISDLPQHVIDAIDQSFKQGKTVTGPQVSIKTGDCLKGAGLLAIHRMWKQEKMDQILIGLTPEAKQSVQLMVCQRILQPGSKLSLKETLKSTLFKEAWSKNRFDEDVLYAVMDVMNENFYTIQEALRGKSESSPVMLLYDITSTYFEGTKAEDGAYGHSRDKRWDRYQVVIGLVCTAEGLPLAIEVWPGNTADKTTVSGRLRVLKERFGIAKAVFVGDAGMYTEANVAEILSAGFDYILKPEWHTQKKQLEKQLPLQQELFDHGHVEWVEDGVRYVGYFSEPRKERAARQREEGMQEAEAELDRLSQIAARGSYYSWTRLREKVNDLMERCGVKGLYTVVIDPMDEGKDPEQKGRLRLRYVLDKAELARRAATDGMYILQTSLGEAAYSASEIDASYKKLQLVERAFRSIKSFLKIRPIYHYKSRRVRAHVLICFLAYYLVKKMELEYRSRGITEEVVPLLRGWNDLQLVSLTVTVGEHSRSEWQWSLGPIGEAIKGQIETLGWWRSIDKLRLSLLKSQ
jgi:transposase